MGKSLVSCFFETQCIYLDDEPDTGLCSYRVRGVDGSCCAKHLTVESYTIIYAASSHTYYY